MSAETGTLYDAEYEQIRGLKMELPSNWPDNMEKTFAIDALNSLAEEIARMNAGEYEEGKPLGTYKRELNNQEMIDAWGVINCFLDGMTPESIIDLALL